MSPGHIRGPVFITRRPGGLAWNGLRQHEADSYDMVRVRLQRHPLTATAAVAWSGNLP